MRATLHMGLFMSIALALGCEKDSATTVDKEYDIKGKVVEISGDKKDVVIVHFKT